MYKKVAICVPCAEHIHTDFAFSLVGMVAWVIKERRDIFMPIIREKGSIIEINRHRLVVIGLGLEAEYILFMDTDQIFPTSTLTRLLDCDKDIIGCNIIMRAPPFTPCAYDLDFKPIGYEEKGIKEVGKIGTGILLVKTEVFKKIGMPYFKTTFTTDPMMWQGEDFNFCQRARAAGYKIWCNHDLSKSVFHIGTKSYGYQKEAL